MKLPHTYLHIDNGWPDTSGQLQPVSFGFSLVNRKIDLRCAARKNMHGQPARQEKPETFTDRHTDFSSNDGTSVFSTYLSLQNILNIFVVL